MSTDAFENAALLNRFMTNEKISVLIGSAEMEIIWLSFPAPSGQPQKSGISSDGRMHSHSFREAHYCTCGTMVFRTPEGKEYTVRSGESILICENAIHSSRSIGEDTKRISIAYRVKGASDPYGIENPDSAVRDKIIVMPDAKEIYELYRGISEEFDRKNLYYREVIETLLFRIVTIYERLTVSEEKEEPYLNRIDSRVDEMISFINNNLAKNISTIDIAEHMHISKRQINRIIMKEFHLSCADLIQTLKLRKAQELLLCTDSSIEDIAGMVGYSSVFSFSKFFKNHEGLPPAMFRKSHYSY